MDSSRRPFLTKFRKLVLLEAIGQGGFGTVYKAKHTKFGYVAYKKISDRPTSKWNHRLLEEASISYKMHHHNIVAMLGLVLEEQSHGLVLEFMANNNLHEYLENNQVEYKQKVHLITDVASGMHYLHSLKPPIIHGDLKILNVLVSDDLRAKVSDFGFSYLKEFSQSMSRNKVRIGTVTHVPPENWKNPHLRKVEAYDVYGFSILMWEVMTQRRPFRGARPVRAIKALLNIPVMVASLVYPDTDTVIAVCVEKGHRPNMADFPGDVSRNVRKLMESSWDQDPKRRPSFAVLKHSLRDELKTFRSRQTAVIQHMARINVWRENGVSGIAWFENKIYVLFKNSKTIRVFADQEPFKKFKHEGITIDPMKCALDMVASSRSRSIFISDRGNRGLWEIQWPRQRVTGWKMKGWPGGLSITPSDKLLVLVVRGKRVYLELCRMLNFKIIESVALPSNIKIVRHAVELSNGNFVISYRNEDSPEVPLLSELSSDGQQIIRTFFPPSIVDPIQLKQWRPVHLAADEDDNIFVADFSSYRPAGGDDRVLLLNPRLADHQLLLQKDQHQISSPKRLCYVREKHMLLIGQGPRSRSTAATVSVCHLAAVRQRPQLSTTGSKRAYCESASPSSQYSYFCKKYRHD